MARKVIIPCSCGKMHMVQDPGKNIRLKCKDSGKPLVYECVCDDNYCLRGEERDLMLGKEIVSIGRLAGNDIVLPIGGLSRKHCVLKLSDNGYSIQDLGSSNGTHLNGERLKPEQPVLLTGGDLLRFADRYFRFLEPAEQRENSPGGNVDTGKYAAVGLEKDNEPVNDKMIGARLGEFTVLEVLSQGGMGRVYRAEQTGTGRQAIVKTIIPENAESDKAVQRFLREIDFGARISHPNIAEFLGTGQVGSTLYLASEFFDGQDLRQWFRKKPATIKTAVIIGRQLADALAAAHKENIIHRDIKPENVMMNKKGKVKVIDFGIGKAMADPNYSALTMNQGAIGTPRYMAPEQLLDSTRVGPRTDVCAAGAVLFYCLTCRPPRAGKSIMEIMRSIKEPIPLASSIRPDTPKALDDIIQRATAVEPDDRYSSAEELRAALASV